MLPDSRSFFYVHKNTILFLKDSWRNNNAIRQDLYSTVGAAFFLSTKDVLCVCECAWLLSLFFFMYSHSATRRKKEKTSRKRSIDVMRPRNPKRYRDYSQ